jgi:hypothetical protein
MYVLFRECDGARQFGSLFKSKLDPKNGSSFARPGKKIAVIEIVADRPLKLGNGALRLNGTWHISSDPDGWRCQLRAAEVKA